MSTFARPSRSSCCASHSRPRNRFRGALVWVSSRKSPTPPVGSTCATCRRMEGATSRRPRRAKRVSEATARRRWAVKMRASPCFRPRSPARASLTAHSRPDNSGKPAEPWSCQKPSPTPSTVTPGATASVSTFRTAPWVRSSADTRSTTEETPSARSRSSASSTRKKLGATRAWSMRPRRARPVSRRLPWTESPVTSAPVTTAVAMASPKATTAPVRQW